MTEEQWEGLEGRQLVFCKFSEQVLRDLDLYLQLSRWYTWVILSWEMHFDRRKAGHLTYSFHKPKGIPVAALPRLLAI